jgi:phospholipid/cholesterol/gamma-HCH transport system ATP-binding protein
MIRVQDLHKSFGDHEVLKGISTEFHQGKTNLIIGKSGSGKTVFLKSMIALFKMDKGEIYYEDKPLTEMSDDEQKHLRTEMGMVFQGNALFDSLNIEYNVTFPLAMFSGMTESQRKDRANEVLARVNLEGVNEKFPAELSGGMKKRVALARGIVMKPKYLFIDEPNSGLDPQTAIVIDNLIHEITQEYNITTVVNTHDMNSVMEIGENIIYIKDGKKAWQGSSEELLTTDNADIDEFVFSSELFRKIKTRL